MSALQPLRVFPAKLDAPETNRFVTNDNPSFSEQILDISMTQVEPIVQPDGVTDYFWWKPITFIYLHPSIMKY